jgi:hypothetical protein
METGTGTVVGVNKLIIPSELRGRIPSAFLKAAELRFPVDLFCFCLACVFLSGFDNRNGWSYFAGAIVSPLLAAIYFLLFPLNPYRTPAAKFSGMYGQDEEDETCKRFVELVQSRSARRVLLTNSLVLSLVLLSAMIAISRFQTNPIAWSVDSQSGAWIILNTLLSSLILVPILVSNLMVWSLKNWGSQRS